MGLCGFGREYCHRNCTKLTWAISSTKSCNFKIIRFQKFNLFPYSSIPFEYEDPIVFSEGLAFVNKDGKYQYIDKSNNVIFPLPEGLAVFNKNFYRASFITSENIHIKNNFFTIPAEHIKAWNFKEGLAKVSNENGDKYGFINKTGELAIPCDFPFAANVSDSLIIAAEGNNDKYYYNFGILDINGNTVVPFIYDSITPFFSEGLAVISKDGKYGFIDTAGNIIIPLQYDFASDFSEGHAVVVNDGELSVIANPLTTIA